MQPQGTAGALKLAQPYLTGGPFTVVHADVLTDISLADFIEFHRGEECLATIAVKPGQSEPNYGKVLLQGNWITEFCGASQDQGISIVNTDVYLFEPQVLDLIEAGRGAKLEEEPCQAGLLQSGKMPLVDPGGDSGSYGRKLSRDPGVDRQCYGGSPGQEDTFLSLSRPNGPTDVERSAGL